MGSSPARVVPSDGIRGQAERLLAGSPSREALVLGFDESTASSVEILVEGASFYPRMLADIAAASSSVHINQFGFRPGVVGDQFADALVAKAAEGVSVRLVVDRQGSDPERSSKAFYDRLTAAGIEVCVVRATRPRVPVGPLANGGPTRWNLSGLGHIDHRKVVVVDGRVGWVGGAGIEDHFEDGRFHDLFVRVEGPVVAQLQLVFVASLRWLGGEVDSGGARRCVPDALTPGPIPVPARVLHNAPGRYRPITDAIADLLEDASETLDVVNPYVTDRGMIRTDRAGGAPRRPCPPVRARQREQLGVRRGAAVPPRDGSWTPACASSSTRRCCTRRRSCGMARSVLAGTCNLEAWSLKRFFEIDLGSFDRAVAAQFEERFSAPAEMVSSPGRPLTATKQRARAAALAAISPLL